MSFNYGCPISNDVIPVVVSLSKFGFHHRSFLHFTSYHRKALLFPKFIFWGVKIFYLIRAGNSAGKVFKIHTWNSFFCPL